MINKKILFVSLQDYFNFSVGASIAFQEIIKDFSRKKVICELFTRVNQMSPLNGSHFESNYLIFNNVKCTLVPLSRSDFIFNFINALKKTILRFKPSTIVVGESTDLNLVRQVIICCRNFHGIRVEYFVQNPQLLPRGPLSKTEKIDPILSMLVCEAFKKIDGVICVSDYLKKYLKKYLKVQAFHFYLPIRKITSSKRHRRKFITMINPSHIKGLSIFLKLIQIFPQHKFAAVLGWATTNDVIRTLQQFSNVTLFQPVRKIEKVFKLTKIVIAPALWGEAFGLIAIEAKQMGIPVIASDIGGLPEAVCDGRFLVKVKAMTVNSVGEFVFPKQDIGPWKKILEKLLEDKPFYRLESQRARLVSKSFISSINKNNALYNYFLVGAKKVLRGA